MKQALLIIDVQNDYFAGGKMELHNPQAALANTIKLLKNFRGKNQPVFHVQHLNEPDDTFFVPNTFGAQIHEQLSPLENEYHIVKHMPSSFLGTTLDELLKGNNITDLVVCGMMSHMCVDTTVRACQDFGYGVILADDACATRDLTYHDEIIPAETVHKTYMASLDDIFAKVMGTEEILL